MFFDKFSNDFEKESGYPISLYGSIPLHQGWKALRSVTFTLDISFFDEALTEIAMIPEDEKDNWRRQEVGQQKLMLDASEGWGRKISEWRALFFHPFDKVTLLTTNASEDADDGTGSQTEKYRSVVDILRDSLDAMGEGCGHDWLMFQNALDWDAICEEEYGDPPARFFNKYDEYDSTPKRKWYKTAELFRFARVQHVRLGDGGSRKYIEKQALRDYIRMGQRIQTKQINFAWNFLSSSIPTPKKLLGKKHTYTAERAESLRKTDQLRRLKYDNQWPHKYEVAAADGLVGEMGIRHPKRWVLASEEYDEYHGVMGRLTATEDVESKGIGMPLWKARKPRAKKVEGEEGIVDKIQGDVENENKNEDKDKDRYEDGIDFQAVIEDEKQSRITDFWRKV